jgi:phosphate transport system substrate-binding protein
MLHRILRIAMGALLASQALAADEPLIWAGCGITKKAFMAELAKAYEQDTGIKINLEGGGAAKGIRRTGAQTADLGRVCRATPKRRTPS